MVPIRILSLIFATALFVMANRITVPDAAPSIQSAIDNAQSGDTVFVKIGTFHESLVLKEGISLIGESMSATIISGSKTHAVITGANNSLVKNLTVQQGKSGIVSENAALTIDQVIVRNNNESGIHCFIALPYIYNSIITRNKWSGILCESTRSIKTSIMHNVIAENGYNGITLEGSSEVLIMNNVIFRNKQYGVWGREESSKSRVIYNAFYENRSSVNLYIKRDMTNITDNPGFSYANGAYDYFTPSSIMLQGKGKEGATIGLIGGEVLTQKRTDPDEDNVILENDRCPSIPEDMDGFEDDDGCPEFDNDKDGIFDTEDACPNSAEDYDGFKDNDGCPDDDNDNDGIKDSVDVCKDHPETMNGFKDDDGCPDEVPPKRTPESPSEATPDTTGNK